MKAPSGDEHDYYYENVPCKYRNDYSCDYDNQTGDCDVNDEEANEVKELSKGDYCNIQGIKSWHALAFMMFQLLYWMYIINNTLYMIDRSQGGSGLPA